MNGWEVKREMAIPIWQERIKACRASGMGIGLWCAENSINRKTYYRWEKLCIATGGDDTIISDVAVMSVGVAPTPTPVPQLVVEIKEQPQDASAPVGEYVTFSVVAENAESYQWQYARTLTSTWYNCSEASFPGATTSEVTVKVTNGRNGYVFQCLVTGGNQTVTSEAATLSVGVKPIVIDGVTYEAITTTTCRVVSYAGIASSLVIPSTVEGMTVTEIVSQDAKNENSVSQRENGVLTRIQKSSGYSPEA